MANITFEEFSKQTKVQIELSDINRILSELYDLRAKNVKELNGYDDRNFLITLIDNTQLVLKIINGYDSKKTTFFEAQNEMLIYLKKRAIKCPQPIATKNGGFNGNVDLKSGNHLVRLLTFMPGTILNQTNYQEDIFWQVGKLAAQIDEALKNFHHPVYDSHKHLWMLENVTNLSTYLEKIEISPKRKSIVEAVIKEFDSRVLSIASQFEKGMIHGDFNEQNIICNKNADDDKWFVDAVIDFGDSQFSCYLYEVALAMTYMIIHGNNVNAGGFVINGYQSVREIPEIEFKLLKVCVAARFCQSLVLGAFSSLQDPNNAYILSTATNGWTLLEEIWATPEAELLAKWKEIK